MAISDYMEDLIYRVLAGEASVEEREVRGVVAGKC